jgi:hypothetical protein
MIWTRLAWMVVGLSLLGCDDESTPKRQPVDWQAKGEARATGPKFEDPDFVLEVKPPKLCDEQTPLAPEKDFKRISVPLRLEAKSRREVPVNPLTFALEDADGHRFRATLAGCAPPLPQGTLKAEQHIEGEVAFDVPVGEQSLELVFEPFVIGREEVRARVKLAPLP